MDLSNWKRPAELLELAKVQTLDSDDLLALKSRSFYGPILLLEKLKGKNEHNKRPYIRVAYNLLRETDEIEDSGLDRNEKIEMMKRLNDIIDKVVKNDEFSSDVLASITPDLESITSKLISGVDKEDAKVFAEHFGRSSVLKEMSTFDRPTKEALHYCAQSMIGGMTKFLELGEIKTADQLHHYCYHVAGRVGSLLHKLITIKDKIDDNPSIGLDTKSAEKFGEYLQIVNILKGIHGDYNAVPKRHFIPLEFLPKDLTRQYVMEQTWIDAIKAREDAFGKMVQTATENLPDSIRYVSAIPAELSGYRAFCLVPLLAANKTLKGMCSAGAEKVFSGDESAVKMQGGIEEIMVAAANLANKSTEEVKAYLDKDSDFSL